MATRMIWMLAIILSLSDLAACSHFRGGIIQWRPVNAQNFDGRIEITHRISWRRSWGSNTACTTSDIGTTRIFGFGTVSCRIGCSGNLGDLTFYCTDFSVTEDWVSGERTYIYNIGTSVTNFEASYSSCCWISLNSGGSGWEIRVKGNLARRTDGLVNSSPRSSITPIVRLQSGCTHSIRIPTQDPNQDVVRCRWATGNECSGVCRALPGATLDQNTCVLSYTATHGTGWYGVAIQVEDFMLATSTTPMSSIPIQFLINVFVSSQPCGTKPTLVPGETPPDGSCIPVPFGTTYHAGIVASTGSPGVSIVRFSTSSPIGLRLSSVTQSPYNSQHYYVNVTWMPTTMQYGIQIFCFSAVSSTNLVSNQSCITLLGGVSGPQALQNSVSPVGRFVPTSSTTWSITFDQAISRPSSSRYIRFYEQNNGRLVYNYDVTSSSSTYPATGSSGRILTFRFTYSFTAGLTYYVLLDSGVAVGPDFCDQESLSVTNSTFWIFHAGCPTGYMDARGTCVDIDECSTGTFTCPANSYCNNTPGSYTCICNTGYEYSGSSCRDIDECARGTQQCDIIALCTNTVGSYTCTCPSGTNGNGFSCTDACNECTGVPANCGTHNCNTTTSDCTNTVGSFQCTCRFGLASDGVSCAPPPRPDPPTSVRITTTGATMFTIVWVAPTPSIGNRISTYNLSLTEDGGTTTNVLVSGTSTLHTFTGLQEYRSYSCVIITVSVYGPLSIATAAVNTTTLEAPPGAPPTNFIATPSTSRSSIITWDPPPFDEQNGIIIHYIINVTVVGTGQTFQLISNTTILSINTLTPFTSYICIIAAVTSAGIGPFSTQFNLVTPQDVPTRPPQNVLLSSNSSTSISITWSPPPENHRNGIITGYQINITEVITGRIITLIHTSTTTSITAPGLHPYYVYECIITAVTIGAGPYSQSINVTTLEDVPSGSPSNFTASASSSRSASISWRLPPADQQNGIIIRYVINVTVIESGQTFQLTSTTTSLTVSNLLPYRNYICIIAAVTSIGIGPFSSRFILSTPQDVPTMAPQNPTAVVRNSRTIFCSWNPPPVEHQNGVIIEYRINITEVNTSRVFVRISPGTTTSLEISSLHPNYIYQWTVTCVTVGAGPYTVFSTIKTLEDIPSGPPQSLGASALSPYSIEITWQPPPLSDQNGVITGYVINITSLATGAILQLTSINTVLQVPNLTPFTNYVCIIAARTAIGVGPFSTVVNTQTLEAAPGSHPSNFTGTSLNSTHIFLSWEPPPPSQVNGVIREYRLNITEDATGMVFQYTTDPINRQIVVGPLHPYYIYHCSVVAFTVQPGPYTAVFTIQTEEDTPSGPPTNFIASAIDSRTITLSWNPPQVDEQNGILRYYFVMLTSILPTETRNVSSSQLSITISGLRPYTTYDCTISAETIGVGPPTVIQQIQTPEDLPTGPPQNFTLFSNDSRSIILNWDLPIPQDVNGIIIDYTINISSSIGTNSFSVQSNLTTYTLTALRPFIAYTCFIAAHTSVGRGPFSTGVTLTTPEAEPGAPPVMISQSNLMSRSVDLSWVAPRRDLQNGVIRYYVIEAYENDTGMTITYQTLSDQTTFTISNIHPFYMYSMKIQAVTVGPGPFSMPYTVNTLQDIPTSAPLMPSGFPVTSTLITLQWAPPPVEDINGIIVFYMVEVTEVLTNTSWTFHAVTTHINIGPLHPYYTYRCRVAAFTIGVGPFTTFFLVNSGEALSTGPPTNLAAPRTTTSSLSLTWNPPRFDLQNGIIRHYVVYIDDISNGNSWQLTSNVSRITINNLQPFFTYNCSVAAFTIGVGPISDSLVVTLPQAPPRLAPTNIQGFAIDHSRVSLEWDAPPTISLNGILSAYIINVTERETGYMFDQNTTNTSIILDSLHPDYVYEFQVAAYTVAAGPFSTIFAVQVLMAAPSGTPENITAIALSSDSMLLIWDPPLLENRNGPILAYNLTVTDQITGLVIQSSVLLNTSAVVYSLQPFSVYNFTLSARTSVGYGPSETVSQITLQDVPSAPVNPIANGVSGDPYSLHVSWLPPLVPNGYLTHYNVYCEESQFAPGFTSTVQAVYLNTTVTGLTPFTNYSCYVSANTSIGEGNASTITDGTTDEYIPADSPTNIQSSIINATSVYLSWSPPLIPYGYIISYTILVEESLTGGNVTTIVAFGNSFTVINLVPFTYYNFSIAASTRIGVGPYDTVITRTPEASPYGFPRSVLTTVTGTTMANVSWNPPDPNLQNGMIIYYTVVLRDLTFNMPDQVYNTTRTTFTFVGLEEYSRYGFRVAAATIAGIGPFSLSVQFTTFEDVPTAPPQNVSGSSLSSSLIMFYWSPPPPLEINGVIRYYTAEVIERHTGRQWTFFAIDPDLHIGSLHPYYYYDFNVSATTVGPGPYSSIISILTDPEPPIAAPEQLSASFTSTSLSLSWNPPPFEDTNGAIQHYMVIVTEVDTSTTFTPRTSIVNQITYNNLHPYYIYECIVAAYTVGLGPYTSPITIQLDQEAPTASVLGLTGTARNSDSISLFWNPPLPSEQNGLIVHYLVNVTELNTGNVYGHVSGGTNFTIFSLHPYYNYSITVTAVTVSPGPVTDPIVITTDQDVPSGPVQSVNVTVLSSEEALIGWRDPDIEDQNGIITGYAISVTLVSTGQSFQMTSTVNRLFLSNLLPFTTYICRVAAMTNVGVGPFSTATSFLTRETAPSSSPDNVMVTANSSTSIWLSWTPPPPATRNGIITEYRINVTELDTGRVMLLTTFATSFVVQALHPYYNYECTVSAHTVATGPYSFPVTIQTPEDIPSGAPQMFASRVESPQSVSFTWRPVLAEEQNGIIINYTINISEAMSGQIIQRTLPSSQTSITVSSLLPFTTYFCSIAASTSVNIGPFSSPLLTVTTLEDSPSMPPTNLTESIQDSSTIIFNWDQPNGRHNGMIREYRVNITEVETGRMFQVVSATTNLVVSNLHPYYTYEWIVTAFTVSEGPYSNTSSVTTPEDVPSAPPTNIVGFALSPNSIFLIWNPPVPEERNGIITGYTINVTNLDNGTVEQFTTTVVSNFTISNLRPFTTYVATISARTAIGMGPFSNVLSVQTLEDAPISHPLNFTGYALNSTHIFLDWIPPLPGDINGILREYRINITEDETGILRQSTTDPTQTEFIAGPLHPFYVYHCTILAYTVEGGPNTTILSIKTEEDVPSGPPTAVTVNATSARSVNLTWGPPNRDQQNGIIRYYLISLQSVAGTTARNVSSVQWSISISGLRPYTLYNCTVQAETVGLGPPNSIIQISTPEDVPTGSPQNVRAQAADPTILNISWYPPVPERINGLIRRYIVSVTELETGTTEQFFTVEDNITIRGRHPFYRYSYVVAAVTIGQGPYSASSIIHMPEAAPSSSPDNIQISAVSATGFLLSWSALPTVNHNGIIQNYMINVTEENTGREFQLTSNGLSHRVESLHPFYNYSCVVAAVTVAAGPYSTPVRVLTSEDVPSGHPQNFSAIIISSTSILLVWTPPRFHEQNGIIISYTINLLSGGNSSTFTTPDEVLMLGSLKPFTSYTLDIAASTLVGSGPSTAAITVTTPEDAPEGAPTNVVSSDITSNSVTLTWSPPPNQLHNGVIRHYIISVVELDTGTNFTYQAQSHTTFSIGDLHPFYTYTFNVFAVTVGVGPGSLDHRVTTLEDIPTAAPESISETAVNSRTLLITWSPPAMESQNGIITEYVLNVSVLETGEQFQRRAQGTATSLSVESLHPDYTYTYIVAAGTSVGRGPFSMSRSVKMPEDVPTIPPLNSTGSAVNSTAIIINWQLPAPYGRNGIITGYSLILTELITNTTTSYSQTGAHIELVIGSLHPFYDYECIIAAETSVGRGPYGDPFITRTSPDVPSGSPDNVSGVAIDSRTVEVTWEPPEADEHNGIIQYYLIMVMVLQNRASLTLNSTSTSVIIPNLHPAYDHSIQVAAVTIGVGPFSSALSITTPDDSPTGPPLSVTAASVSSTSIRISWEAPLLELQNGQITSYQIVIMEMETGLIRTFTTVPTDSIYVVNSLHPFYIYNCSVAAYTNGLGPSDHYVVQTLPEEPNESPGNVSAIAMNATSVIVTWIPPPPEDRNGIIQSFTIRVVGVHTDEDFTRSINATEISIKNLHPFYSYKFTVAAVTVSHGPFSNPITLMMPPLAPTSGVDNITAGAITPTSMRLRWLPPNQDEWNGVIHRYTIEYGILGPVQTDDDEDGPNSGLPRTPIMTFITFSPSSRQSLNNNPNPTLATSPLVWEELEIYGLEEYFEYEFSIFYENSAGRSDSSYRIGLDMPPAAPSGPPTGISVTLSESSIAIQWNPPELFERNGPIINYDVILIYKNTSNRVYTVERNDVRIEGLPKFTDINVTVAARTSVGLGPASLPVSVKTNESPPEAPRAVQGVIIDKNTISISWSPPSNPNGIVLEYQVNYYGYKGDRKSKVTKRQTITILDGPYTVSVPSNQTSYLAKNLQSGLFYSFTVRARTSPGYGANSTTLDVDLSNVDNQAVVSSNDEGSTVAVAVVLTVVILILVIVIVVIYIWRRRRSYTLFKGGRNKRLRGGAEPIGVQNTNFYEVEGQYRDNPAVEMDEATYDVIIKNQDGDETPNPTYTRPAKLEDLPASDEGEVMKLDLAAEAKAKQIENEEEDEVMKLDLAAEAKAKQIENEDEEDDDEDDDEIDEKTKIDLGKSSEEEIEDNEVAYL